MSLRFDQNSLLSTTEYLIKSLGKIVPEFELRQKAELAFEINQLKQEMNAVILGHNYMEPALFHSVPDIVGDSLELSRRAADTTADIIVFCGVEFMAETAKILNPEKLVLLPALKAGCSLAESITAEDVRQLKSEFPGVPVVTYINTYADVKAECDACCTSGNAKRVIESFGENTIIFLPDEYLATNLAKETGKNIILANDLLGKKDKPKNLQVIGWQGKCEVHDQFKVSDITMARKQFPTLKVLAHPECPPAVVEASDYSGSTTQMINYVQKDNGNGPFMLLTECSMADNIIAENPEKEILRLCSIRCPHMNQITLEGVLNSLQNREKQIDVPEEIRIKALKSVQRMLEL